MGASSTNHRLHVMVVHNQYQQAGGEDTVFEQETEMLKASGFRVTPVAISNHEIDGILPTLKVALQTPHSFFGARLIKASIREFRPDIVHVHNTFPRLSASIFWELKRANIPVVYTLHNFRLFCANGHFFRNGHICERCLGRSAFGGVVRKCYRSSIAGSLVNCVTNDFHKLIRTWQTKVDRFIVPSSFALDKFATAGIPREKMTVKPNFIRDPLGDFPIEPGRKGAVFAGRLSKEKGVKILLEAWEGLDVPLTIVGDGPEKQELERQAARNPAIRFLGKKTHSETLSIIARSEAIVVPSIWNEMFGLSVIEAMSLGVPVIASKVGALAELVSDGANGRHVPPGDAARLRETARTLFANPDLLMRMGEEARRTYLAKFTPSSNMNMLAAIYDTVRNDAFRLNAHTVAAN